MKRKTTDLEKNLIKKGFQLIQKNYAGKHSEKTLNYIYDGVVDTYEFRVGVRVVIDAKREKILTIGIKDPLVFLGTGNVINFSGVKLLGVLIDEITYFIYGVKDKEKDADETVEIVEEIENETQGTETD